MHQFASGCFVTKDPIGIFSWGNEALKMALDTSSGMVFISSEIAYCFYFFLKPLMELLNDCLVLVEGRGSSIQATNRPCS